MTDFDDAFRRLSERGPHRDPDEVIASALGDAAAEPTPPSSSPTHDPTGVIVTLYPDNEHGNGAGPPPTPPSRSGLERRLPILAGGLAAAIVLVLGIILVTRDSDDGLTVVTDTDSIETADPTPTPAPEEEDVSSVAGEEGAADPADAPGESESDEAAAPDPTVDPTAEPIAEPTAAPTPEPTPAATPTAVPPDLAPWLGTFTWTEIARGGLGSDQVLVHELTFTELATDGRSLVGTFEENGFQTARTIEVSGQPVDGGNSVAIVAATSDDLGLYGVGVELFRLSGDPTGPTTDLGAVAYLLGDIAPTGAYFLPGEGGITEISVEPWALALAPDGLIAIEPSSSSVTFLPFGTDQTQIIVAVESILGPALDITAGTAECPNGQTGFARWAEISLEFGDDAFIAWSLAGDSPLTTMTGLGLQATRDELVGDLNPDIFESTLGTEFFAGAGDGTGFGGILSTPDDAGTVETMWAGSICAFR